MKKLYKKIISFKFIVFIPLISFFINIIIKPLFRCFFNAASDIFLLNHFQNSPNSTHFSIIMSILAIMATTFTLMISSNKYNINYIDFINGKRNLTNSPPKNNFLNINTLHDKLAIVIIEYIIILITSTIFDLLISFSIVTLISMMICIYILYLYCKCWDKKSVEDLIEKNAELITNNIYNSNISDNKYISDFGKFNNLLFNKYLSTLDLQIGENVDFIARIIFRSNSNQIALLARDFKINTLDVKNINTLYHIFMISSKYSELLYYKLKQWQVDIKITFKNIIIYINKNVNAELIDYSKKINSQNLNAFKTITFIILIGLCSPLIQDSRSNYTTVYEIIKSVVPAENCAKYILAIITYDIFLSTYTSHSMQGSFGNFFDIDKHNQYKEYNKKEKNMLKILYYCWNKSFDDNIDINKINKDFNKIINSILTYKFSDNHQLK